MKKKIIIIIGSIISLIIIATLLFYNKIIIQETNHKKEMEGSFSESMIVIKETTLYKKESNKYIDAGKVSVGVTLYLKQEKINTKKDRYYKIEDTPYYIDYQHLEKIEGINLEENPYLPFAEEVITKENHTLTISLPETTQKIEQSMSGRYQIIIKEKEQYQVLFQNRIWTIKKEEVEKIDVLETEHQEIAKGISVVLITSLEKNKIDSLLTLVKEKYTIKLDDYHRWINEEVQLKEDVILLLTEDKNIKEKIIGTGLTSNLVENASKQWTLNNSQSRSQEQKPSVYMWTPTTKEEDITKIINGEKIITVAPPLTVLPSPNNTNAVSIPVLNYHFFYDGSKGNPCRENICLDSRKLEEHLKYLQDNNFKTLTMEEYKLWIYGKIELPKKSVLITIDDGAMGTSKINGNVLIPMLEKYKMNATLFLITAWWDKSNYESPYLEIESHGYDIHTRVTCNEKTTSKGACLSKEELKQDLKKSTDILGKKTAFCYPFYIYTNTMIEGIKESGFSLGFIGGSKKSTRSNHKYKIPRYPVYESTTMQQFITMVN